MPQNGMDSGCQRQILGGNQVSFTGQMGHGWTTRLGLKMIQMVSEQENSHAFLLTLETQNCLTTAAWTLVKYCAKCLQRLPYPASDVSEPIMCNYNTPLLLPLQQQYQTKIYVLLIFLWWRGFHEFHFPHTPSTVHNKFITIYYWNRIFTFFFNCQ